MKKLISLLLISTFFCQNVYPYTSELGDGHSYLSTESEINNYRLPLKNGQITSRINGKNGVTIFHIEDAHCDYDAQKNIYEIIAFLNKNHTASLAAMEGGSGKYDFSFFDDIKDPRKRRVISDYFVKEGKVNGAEFFAINNPGAIKLIGIEDIDIYNKNLKAYRDFIPDKEKSIEAVSGLKTILAKLKLLNYGVNLIELDALIKKYETGEIKLNDYIAYLSDYAGKASIDTDYFYLFQDYKKLIDVENSIDFEKAEAERNELFAALEDKLSLKSLENIKVKTALFSSGGITSAEYYSELFRAAKWCEIDLYSMPNFMLYSVYASRYESFDLSGLMSEMNRIREKCYEGSFKNEKERAVYYFAKRLSYLENIMNLSITSEDWGLYNTGKGKDDFEKIKDLMPGDEREYFEGAINTLYGASLKMEKFYEYSFERDRVFVSNIKKALDGKVKNIILITGGFHADNLRHLLSEEGYSYIGIIPNGGKNDVESPYLSLLAGEPKPFDVRLNDAMRWIGRSSTLAILSPFSEAGRMDLADKRIAMAMELAIGGEKSDKAELINISSGNWPEKAHDDLNARIKDSFDAAREVSDRYDHDVIKNDIKELLPLLENLPPPVKEYLSELLKKIDPSIDLKELLSRIQRLLDNPRLKLFFLVPEYGEDKFTLVSDAAGREEIYFAAAHFGHDRTSGDERKENIYISSPYYDSLTQGERLALVTHELAHLALGKGNDVHALGRELEEVIKRAYDKSKFNLDKISEDLLAYLLFKRSLYYALEKNNRSEAQNIYRKLTTLLDTIGDEIGGISLSTITEIYFKNLSALIGPAVSDIVRFMHEAEGNVNHKGIIIDQILALDGIDGPIGQLIYDTLAGYDFGPSPTERDILNSLLIICEKLALEIKSLSQKEFSSGFKSQIEKIVEEVVNSLFADAAPREKWLEKILSDIGTYYLPGFIPEKWFLEEEFHGKRDLLTASLMGITNTSNALGALFMDTGKIYFNSRPNLLEVRATLIHELVHYLAHNGVIKIDPAWEFTTYSVDLADRILFMAGREKENIAKVEENIKTHVAEYGPGVIELYRKGKEIAKGDDAGYILRPNVSNDKAGYFSINLLVGEAIKTYENMGLFTGDLKKYLLYQKYAPLTDFEKMEARNVTYKAQHAASVITAGILVSEWERTGVEPLKNLKEYFDELYKIFGPPSERDLSVIKDLERLALTLFGMTSVSFEEASSTDELGLWEFEAKDQFSARIKFWPFTLKSNAKFDKLGETARRRAIGHMLLAYYRYFYGSNDSFEKNRPDLFEDKFFNRLWTFMLIPSSIYKGTNILRTKGAGTSPFDIKLIFDNLFNLGNKRVEKELFNSYPLHLQYINSILFRWSQTKERAKDAVSDTRIEDGSLVDAAIRETYEAWRKIFFEAASYNDLDSIMKIVENEIWPIFKKLIDEDIRIERDRKLIEKLENEDKIKHGEFDAEKINSLQKKLLEDYFNSLPPEMREAIIGAVLDFLSNTAMMSQNVTSSASQGGSPPASSSGDSTDLGSSLEELDSLTNSLQNLISKMSKKTEDINALAEKISKDASMVGGNEGASDQITEETDKLQDLASQFKNKSALLENAAAKINSKGQKLSQNLSIPDIGKDVNESAANLEHISTKESELSGQLLEKANALVKEANNLKELMESGNISQGHDQAGKVTSLSSSIDSDADVSRNSLDEVGRAIGEVTKSINELSRLLLEDDSGDNGEFKDIGEKLKSMAQEAQSSSSESGPGASSEGVSTTLSLPPNSTSLDNILRGNVNRSKPAHAAGRPGAARKDMPEPDKALLAEQALQDELLRTGLTQEELEIYKKWRDSLGAALIDEMHESFREFLVKRLGVKFIRKRDTGDLVDPVAAKEGERGFAVMRKKNPVPIFLSFVIDKSGSMGEGERLNWAKLTIMLFLEVIFEINEEFGGQEPLIKFEILVYDGSTKSPILNHRTSEELNISKKPKIIYMTLAAIAASGGTDDKQALVDATARVKEATQEEDKILKIVLNIQDGNFGDASIKEIIRDAEDNDDIVVLVASVGDKKANANVRTLAGKENSIIPSKLSDLPELAGDKIVEIMNEKFPQPDAAAYFNEKSREEIDREIREIFDNEKIDNFGFLPGWGENEASHDKGKGNLFDSMPSEEGSKYKDLLLSGLMDLSETYPEIRGYDIVLMDGITFSGHYGVSRKRIYVPLEILKISFENAGGKGKDIIKDFILHHYAENLFTQKSRNVALTPGQEEFLQSIEGISRGDGLSLHDKIVLYFKELDRKSGKIDNLNRSVYEQAELFYNERLRPSGYRHFYYQTINGKDYLIFKKTLASGRVVEYKWRRGGGGRYVPGTVTIDNDYNEETILKILNLMYQQGAEYSSYSSDGRFFVREMPDGTIILNSREDNNSNWQSAVEDKFKAGDALPAYTEVDGYKQYSFGGVNWRLDAKGNISINDGKNFVEVPSNMPFSENIKVIYSTKFNGYVIFDSVNKRVVIAKKFNGSFKIETDLSIDSFPSDYGKKILAIEGEPGLGKDELIRAAAHLMNEEIYYIPGHSEAEASDFTARHILIKGQSRYIYSPLNHVQHFGGWVVISEGQYIPQETLDVLKKSVASFTHRRPIADDKTGKMSWVDNIPNHSRARILLTTNIKRKGIKTEGIKDEAFLDRMDTLHFVWQRPPDEREFLVNLVLERMKKSSPGISDEELSILENKLDDAAIALVEIATHLRLTFMGYSAPERQKLVENNYANWTSLLRAASFKKSDTGPGVNLVRAPSPRILANILEFTARYPKTWKNAPWSVIKMFYNFDVNDLKEEQRKEQHQTVKTRFESLPYGPGNNKYIKDTESIEPVFLTAKSFSIEGEYLLARPVATDGKTFSETWDEIRIWVSPEARIAYKHSLPDEIRFWLSSGNLNNSKLLYSALQTLALRKNVMAVGEQGTGKSFLMTGIAKLLGGPQIESQEMSQATKLSDLTWKPVLDAEGDSDFEEGAVLRGARKNKVVFIDEIAAGRPSVQAGLNEALERKYVTMPDGDVIQGGNGFVFLLAANTPGGPFNVEAPSDEFIERSAVLKFDPLTAEEMYEFLIGIKAANGMAVNPRIIGEKKKNSSGNIEKIMVGPREEERWTGLVGVTQYLRHKVMASPNKKLLPRVPGFRTWMDLIIMIASSWQEEDLWGKDDRQYSQKELWEMFKSKFKQNARNIRVLGEYEEILKEAFRESGLWINGENEDGVKKYLDGEDMRFIKLPILRPPKSGDENIDSILAYLQEVTRGGGVLNMLNELEGHIKSIFGTPLILSNPPGTTAWHTFTFDERLKRMYKLREIWQILNILTSIRGTGSKLDNYIQEDYDKMREIMVLIQSRVFEEDWPASFLIAGSGVDNVWTYEEAWENLYERACNLPATIHLGIDVTLGKIAVNIDDEDYVKKEAEYIRKTADKICLDLRGKFLHEIVPYLGLFMHTYQNVLRIRDKYPENKIIQSLAEYLASLDAGNPMKTNDLYKLTGPEAAKEFPETMSDEIFDIMGKLVKSGKTMEGALDSTDPLKEEIISTFKKYESFLPLFYKSLIALAIKKKNNNDDSKLLAEGAKSVYLGWRSIIKSNERAAVPIIPIPAFAGVNSAGIQSTSVIPLEPSGSSIPPLASLGTSFGSSAIASVTAEGKASTVIASAEGAKQSQKITLPINISDIDDIVVRDRYVAVKAEGRLTIYSLETGAVASGLKDLPVLFGYKLTGKHLVIKNVDNKATVYSLKTGQPVPGLENLENVGDYDLTDTHILVKNFGSRITVYSFETGKPVPNLQNLDASMGNSLTDKHLLAVGSAGFASVYSLETGKSILLTLIGLNGYRLTDKHLLVRDSRYHRVTVYSLKTGQVVKGLKDLSARYGYELTDNYVLVSNRAKKVTVYSLETGKSVRDLKNVEADGGYQLTTKYLFVLDKNNDIASVYLLETGQIVTNLGNFAPDKVSKLTDKYILVTHSVVKTVTVLSLETGRHVHDLINLRAELGARLTDNYLIVINRDHEITVYSLKTGLVIEGLKTIPTIETRDYKNVIVSSENNKLVISYSASERVSTSVIPAEGKTVSVIPLEPSGSSISSAIASVTAEGEARVEGSKSITYEKIEFTTRENIKNFALSDDGSRLALYKDAFIAVYDIVNNTHIADLRMDATPDYMYFPSDNKLLLVSARYTSDSWNDISLVSLFDNDTGQKLWETSSTDELVKSLGFLENHGRIILGFSDGSFTIIDASSGVRLATISSSDAHSSNINTIAVSPDGKMFATGSDDGEIKIWDSSFYNLKYTILITPTAKIRSLSFSKDGKKLIAASNDAFAIIDIDKTFDANSGNQFIQMPADSIKENAIVVYNIFDRNTLKVTPDGKVFILNFELEQDGTLNIVTPNGLVLMDIATGKSISKVEDYYFDNTKNRWKFAASKDGLTIASIGPNGEVIIRKGKIDDSLATKGKVRQAGARIASLHERFPIADAGTFTLSPKDTEPELTDFEAPVPLYESIKSFEELVAWAEREEASEASPVIPAEGKVEGPRSPEQSERKQSSSSDKIVKIPSTFESKLHQIEELAENELKKLRDEISVVQNAPIVDTEKLIELDDIAISLRRFIREIERVNDIETLMAAIEGFEKDHIINSKYLSSTPTRFTEIIEKLKEIFNKTETNEVGQPVVEMINEHLASISSEIEDAISQMNVLIKLRDELFNEMGISNAPLDLARLDRSGEASYENAAAVLGQGLEMVKDLEISSDFALKINKLNDIVSILAQIKNTTTPVITSHLDAFFEAIDAIISHMGKIYILAKAAFLEEERIAQVLEDMKPKLYEKIAEVRSHIDPFNNTMSSEALTLLNGAFGIKNDGNLLTLLFEMGENARGITSLAELSKVYLAWANIDKTFLEDLDSSFDWLKDYMNAIEKPFEDIFTTFHEMIIYLLPEVLKQGLAEISQELDRLEALFQLKRGLTRGERPDENDPSFNLWKYKFDELTSAWDGISHIKNKLLEVNNFETFKILWDLVTKFKITFMEKAPFESEDGQTRQESALADVVLRKKVEEIYRAVEKLYREVFRYTPDGPSEKQEHEVQPRAVEKPLSEKAAQLLTTIKERVAIEISKAQRKMTATKKDNVITTPGALVDMLDETMDKTGLEERFSRISDGVFPSHDNITAFSGYVKFGAYSSDSKLLAILDRGNNTLDIYDSKTMELLVSRQMDPLQGFLGIGFTNDDNFIVVITKDEERKYKASVIMLKNEDGTYDISDDLLSNIISDFDIEAGGTFAVSTNGIDFAVTRGRELHIYTIRDDRPINTDVNPGKKRINNQRKITSVKFSYHSCFIAVGSTGGIVKLYDVARGEFIAQSAYDDHSGIGPIDVTVTSLAFSRDNKYIAAALSTGEIRFYKIYNRKLTELQRFYPGEPSSSIFRKSLGTIDYIEFTKNDKYFVVILNKMNPSSTREVKETQVGQTFQLTDMSKMIGKVILFKTDRNEDGGFDIENVEPVAKMANMSGDIKGIGFSDDGSLFSYAVGNKLFTFDASRDEEYTEKEVTTISSQVDDKKTPVPPHFNLFLELARRVSVMLGLDKAESPDHVNNGIWKAPIPEKIEKSRGKEDGFMEKLTKAMQPWASPLPIGGWPWFFSDENQLTIDDEAIMELYNMVELLARDETLDPEDKIILNLTRYIHGAKKKNIAEEDLKAVLSGAFGDLLKLDSGLTDITARKKVEYMGHFISLLHRLGLLKDNLDILKVLDTDIIDLPFVPIKTLINFHKYKEANELYAYIFSILINAGLGHRITRDMALEALNNVKNISHEHMTSAYLSLILLLSETEFKSEISLSLIDGVKLFQHVFNKIGEVYNIMSQAVTAYLQLIETMYQVGKLDKNDVKHIMEAIFNVIDKLPANDKSKYFSYTIATLAKSGFSNEIFVSRSLPGDQRMKHHELVGWAFEELSNISDAEKRAQAWRIFIDALHSAELLDDFKSIFKTTNGIDIIDMAIEAIGEVAEDSQSMKAVIRRVVLYRDLLLSLSKMKLKDKQEMKRYIIKTTEKILNDLLIAERDGEDVTSFYIDLIGALAKAGFKDKISQPLETMEAIITLAFHDIEREGHDPYRRVFLYYDLIKALSVPGLRDHIDTLRGKADPSKDIFDLILKNILQVEKEDPRTTRSYRHTAYLNLIKTLFVYGFSEKLIELKSEGKSIIELILENIEGDSSHLDELLRILFSIFYYWDAQKDESASHGSPAVSAQVKPNIGQLGLLFNNPLFQEKARRFLQNFGINIERIVKGEFTPELIDIAVHLLIGYLYHIPLGDITPKGIKNESDTEAASVIARPEGPKQSKDDASLGSEKRSISQKNLDMLIAKYESPNTINDGLTEIAAILDSVKLTDEQKEIKIGHPLGTSKHSTVGSRAQEKLFKNSGIQAIFTFMNRDGRTNTIFLILLEETRGRTLTKDEFDFLLDKLKNGGPYDRLASSSILSAVKLTQEQKETRVDIKFRIEGADVPEVSDSQILLEDAVFRILWHLYSAENWLMPAVVLSRYMKDRVIEDNIVSDILFARLGSGRDFDRVIPTLILDSAKLSSEQKTRRKALGNDMYNVFWDAVKENNIRYGLILMFVEAYKGKNISEQEFDFLFEKMSNGNDRERSSAAAVLAVWNGVGHLIGNMAFNYLWTFYKENKFEESPILLIEALRNYGNDLKVEELLNLANEEDIKEPDSPQEQQALVKNMLSEEEIQKSISEWLIHLGIVDEGPRISIPDEFIEASWKLLTINGKTNLDQAIEVFNKYGKEFSGMDWFLNLLSKIKEAQNEEVIGAIDVRGQMSEVRGQRGEDRGQRAEVRGQGAEGFGAGVLLAEIMRHRFEDGEEAVINIPVSEMDIEKIKDISEDGVEGLMRKSIDPLGQFVPIHMGKITFHFYRQSELTSSFKSLKFTDSDGKDLPNDRVISFVYLYDDVSTEIVKNKSYVVFLEPDMKADENSIVITPSAHLAVLGLAILNYFRLKNIDDNRLQDINIGAVARALTDVISIAKKNHTGMSINSLKTKINSRGFIVIPVQSLPIEKIRDFYELERTFVASV